MISIIVPAYNEASNLRVLWDRIRSAWAALPQETFECLIVDDGSRDDTPRILAELRREDPRLHWLRLFENCGSHEAIGRGLKAARGEAAMVLAADLQDPPEVFKELITQWRAGAKVVWAVRADRPGETWINRTASLLYYRVMNFLIRSGFPESGADFFLVDREVIEKLGRTYSRHAPNVFFQIASLGFGSSGIHYVKRERHSGRSKWGLKKRVHLFVDSVIAFSPPLLRWAAGAALTAASLWALLHGQFFWAAVPAAVLAFYLRRICVLWLPRPAVGQSGSFESSDRMNEIRNP